MALSYYVEHGDAWVRDADRHGRTGPSRHVAGGSELLAVAWSAEEETVVRMGSHDSVLAWMGSERGSACEALFGRLLVAAFPVHHATAALMTRLSANPGLAARMEQELAAIGAAHPHLTLPPWVPK